MKLGERMYAVVDGEGLVAWYSVPAISHTRVESEKEAAWFAQKYPERNLRVVAVKLVELDLNEENT